MRDAADHAVQLDLVDIARRRRRRRASASLLRAHRHAAAAIPHLTPSSCASSCSSPRSRTDFRPGSNDSSGTDRSGDGRRARQSTSPSACVRTPRPRTASRAIEEAPRHLHSACSRRPSTSHRRALRAGSRACSKYLQCSCHFAGGTPRWKRDSAASGLFREKPGFALPQNFPARYVALRTRVCRSR